MRATQKGLVRVEVAAIVDRLIADRARAASAVRRARGRFLSSQSIEKEVKTARTRTTNAREAAIDALVSLILEARP